MRQLLLRSSLYLWGLCLSLRLLPVESRNLGDPAEQGIQESLFTMYAHKGTVGSNNMGQSNTRVSLVHGWPTFLSTAVRCAIPFIKKPKNLKPERRFEDWRDEVGSGSEAVAREEDEFNGVQKNAERADAYHQDGRPCRCQLWMFEGVGEVVYLPHPAAVGADEDTDEDIEENYKQWGNELKNP